VLIPQECHKLPHENPLAALLGLRSPIVTVRRAAQSSRTHCEDKHRFGRERGRREGRRPRQLHAVLGEDLVTISSDVDERCDNVMPLVCGLFEAYHLAN
jgi:hypothetical protein